MKGFLQLLSCCVAVLVAGSYIELDAYDILLQTRDSNGRLQLEQRSQEGDLTLSPPSYLLRRATNGADQKESASLTQDEGGSSSFQGQPKGHNPGPSRKKRGNPMQYASISGQGPAHMWTGHHPGSSFQTPLPGVPKSMHVAHHTMAKAGGQAFGFPQPDVALKATAKGHVAVGEVHAPPGGYGYIRTETPAESEYLHVPGGSSRMGSAHGSGKKDAKVTAAVTRGGAVQTVAHSLNRVSSTQATFFDPTKLGY